MTKRKVGLERRSPMPFDRCNVTLRAGGPETRGELGKMMMRRGGISRILWWLRCPWCREMVEVPEPRLNMTAGRIWIKGSLTCEKCESTFEVAGGVATKESQNGRPGHAGGQHGRKRRKRTTKK